MPADTRFLVPADALVDVRHASHAAVQWASLAARANLSAASDDSHSNLGWDTELRALLSHPLDTGGRWQLGFSFGDAALLWCDNGAVVDKLAVAARSQDDAHRWTNRQLADAQLALTDDATLPYELPAPAYHVLSNTRALHALGGWFDAAHRALTVIAQKAATLAIATPIVRCWPHHYDIATLASLGEGDPETAPSIGIGLSPGDETIAEPYFYCSPWPAPKDQPAAPEPWHWHTAGFTSLVCPVHRLDQNTDLAALLRDAFGTAHGALE